MNDKGFIMGDTPEAAKWPLRAGYNPRGESAIDRETTPVEAGRPTTNDDFSYAKDAVRRFRTVFGEDSSRFGMDGEGTSSSIWDCLFDLAARIDGIASAPISIGQRPESVQFRPIRLVTPTGTIIDLPAVRLTDEPIELTEPGTYRVELGRVNRDAEGFGPIDPPSFIFHDPKCRVARGQGSCDMDCARDYEPPQAPANLFDRVRDILDGLKHGARLFPEVGAGLADSARSVLEMTAGELMRVQRELATLQLKDAPIGPDRFRAFVNKLATMTDIEADFTDAGTIRREAEQLIGGEIDYAWMHRTYSVEDRDAAMQKLRDHFKDMGLNEARWHVDTVAEGLGLRKGFE